MQVTIEPFNLSGGDHFVIFSRATFAKPTYDSDVPTIGLQTIQQTSEGVHIDEGLSHSVRSGVACDEVVQPIGDAVEVGDCSVHIEVDCFSHLIHFLSSLYLNYTV
jgi:hypothetical protein